MAKDYYKILGIDKKASKDDVKKAFRTLAHKHHPDKKSGDEAKFKEINEAYSILSDDKKRAEYDAYGRVFSDGRGSEAGQNGGFQGFDFSQFTGEDGSFGNINFGDIFSDFFGGKGTRARRGHDISIDLELSFEESVFGINRSILLSKSSPCQTCGGSGSAPGTKLSTCTACNGRGKIREVKSTILGSFATERVCGGCNGQGKIPSEKCKSCGGAGVLRRENEINVKIPAGIENGEMIRLTGAGESIRNGSSGDLYIKVHVKKHPTFRKDGRDLITDLRIKLSDALLGVEYNLKTLDGDITLKIPANIAFGETLRIRGRGVPGERGQRGDLLVKITIVLPQSISREARRKIEELRKEGI